jgi:hypothetical protein
MDVPHCMGYLPFRTLINRSPYTVKRTEDSRLTLERWIAEGVLLKSEGTTSVSLARSISSICGYGSEDEKNGEREVTELSDAIGAYPHLLFILVDGLGINQQAHFPEGGFFETYLNRTIRSVFPSTTAAALTSLASAKWPATHAITGWFTHIPKHKTTVVPLRAVERQTEEPIDEFDIPYSDIMRVESIYPELERATDIYTFSKFKTGHFADWYSGNIDITRYRNMSNAVRRIRRGVSKRVRRGKPSFSYVYFSQVDHLSHAYGRESDEVLREIALTDKALGQLRSELPEDVRIIVTADHGHIDIPKDRQYLLKHDDSLMNLLECPPSGESRIPLFHVKNGSENAFISAFDDRSKGDFILITPDDAETLKLYGPEALHPETRKRLGAFIGISREADAIEYVSEGKESVEHIGMHGGMSPDEIEVPLFLA